MAIYSKEQACLALQRYPTMDANQRRYCQAIIDGTLSEYYLADFLRKRDDFSDDLPEVDVRTLPATQGNRKIVFKCQGNYLAGLGLSLRCAIDDGVITDTSIISLINSLLGDDLIFTIGDSQNEHKIKKINDILNRVIEFIKKQRK